MKHRHWYEFQRIKKEMRGILVCSVISIIFYVGSNEVDYYTEGAFDFQNVLVCYFERFNRFWWIVVLTQSIVRYSKLSLILFPIIVILIKSDRDIIEAVSVLDNLVKVSCFQTNKHRKNAQYIEKSELSSNMLPDHMSQNTMKSADYLKLMVD